MRFVSVWLQISNSVANSVLQINPLKCQGAFLTLLCENFHPFVT